MNILWDRKKAAKNYHKHQVRFSDAETVLFDPMALSFEDDDVHGEQRFITIGSDALSRILVLVYTYRGEDIRLISARTATPKERRNYEKGI